VGSEDCMLSSVGAAGCPNDALKLHRYDRTQTFEHVLEFAVKVIEDNTVK